MPCRFDGDAQTLDPGDVRAALDSHRCKPAVRDLAAS